MDAAFPTDALAVHHSLLTLDTHIDIPWPTGPDPFEDGKRHVDLPKMRRGGMTAAVFAAYVPQAARTPASEAAAFARAEAMLLAIRAMGEVGERNEAGIVARLATSADEIEAAKRDGALAVVPAVENGFAIGTDLGRLARFAELGAIYMTITHNGHNALADSSNPRADLGDREIEHDGISPLGRAAVAEMNRLGMLVDVAHVSRASMMQLAECSRTPVVATHSCIRALCDNPRNLDDTQLDVLRDVGGVVQVTAVSAFLRPNAKPEAVTVADFADHILGRLAQMPEEHYDCRTRPLARANFPIHAALLLAGERNIEILKQIPERAHRNQVAAGAEPALTPLQTQRDRF